MNTWFSLACDSLRQTRSSPTHRMRNILRGRRCAVSWKKIIIFWPPKRPGFYLLPTPEAGKNSCHSVFEFWRLCGIHLPLLSHVVFRIVLASKSYLAIFIGMDWYGTTTLLDFPQQPETGRRATCDLPGILWLLKMNSCRTMNCRWAPTFLRLETLNAWQAPPFLPIRHDPSVRQVFGWRNGYIMVTSCRLGIATGRRYTKIKDQGVQIRTHLHRCIFWSDSIFSH